MPSLSMGLTRFKYPLSMSDIILEIRFLGLKGFVGGSGWEIA